MSKKIDLQAGFYLEGWFVEPEIARLIKDGKIVQLEPKIMSVLLMLAENQGKVVKKEQFFKTIWADIHVTEHVLARAISEIRRIFNDNPQNSRVIQTHSKNGYRLIAPVFTQIPEKASPSVWRLKTANFLPQTVLSINMTNLLFFLSGIFVMIVFITMFLILVMNKHGAGDFH